MDTAFSWSYSVSFALDLVCSFSIALCWFVISVIKALRVQEYVSHALCPQKEQSCVQNWATLVCSKECSQESSCCSWERPARFGHPLLSVASTVTFWFQRGKRHEKPSEVQPRSDPHLLRSCLSDW